MTCQLLQMNTTRTDLSTEQKYRQRARKPLYRADLVTICQSVNITTLHNYLVMLRFCLERVSVMSGGVFTSGNL